MSEQKINFKNNYEGILLDRGYRIMWDKLEHRLEHLEIKQGFE